MRITEMPDRMQIEYSSFNFLDYFCVNFASPYTIAYDIHLKFMHSEYNLSQIFPIKVQGKDFF